MSMQLAPTHANPDRFEFDKADRMRRAMKVAGVSVQEMADSLEVGRNTIGNWINGHTEPKRRDLREFALRTGFPVVWLETGEVPEVGSDGFEPTASTVESRKSNLIQGPWAEVEEATA